MSGLASFVVLALVLSRDESEYEDFCFIVDGSGGQAIEVSWEYDRTMLLFLTAVTIILLLLMLLMEGGCVILKLFKETGGDSSFQLALKPMQNKKNILEMWNMGIAGSEYA